MSAGCVFQWQDKLGFLLVPLEARRLLHVWWIYLHLVDILKSLPFRLPRCWLHPTHLVQICLPNWIEFSQKNRGEHFNKYLKNLPPG